MTNLDIALLGLRLATGGVFAAHGAQKVLGWWGGQGLRGWQGTMARMGYRPTLLFAAMSALAELAGGLALAVGLLTPIVGMVVLGQAVVITAGVHWPRGFFNRDNGFEFPMVLAAGFLAILLVGPGSLSLDAVIGFDLSDVARDALAVVAVLGGLALLAVPRLTRERGAAPG